MEVSEQGKPVGRREVRCPGCHSLIGYYSNERVRVQTTQFGSIRHLNAITCPVCGDPIILRNEQQP